MHISLAPISYAAAVAKPFAPPSLAKFDNVVAKPGSGQQSRRTEGDDPVGDMVEKYSDYFFGLPGIPMLAWSSDDAKLFVFATAAELALVDDAIVRDNIEGVAIEFVPPEGTKADRNADAWYNQESTQAQIASGLPGVHEHEYGFRTNRWSFYTTSDAHTSALKMFIGDKIGASGTRFEKWFAPGTTPAFDAARGAALTTH